METETLAGARPGSPVLVTGANGFIASHLCRALREAGCEVRGLILAGTDPSVLDEMGVPWVAGDITQPETLTEPMAGVKTVFHLAALARDWGKRSLFMRVNAEGTRHVLEAASKASVERFVHMSSLAVHKFTGYVDADEDAPLDNHINGYCTSKIAAEHLVHKVQEEGRFETTIIRPGAIIHGPGDTTSFDKLAPYLERGKMILVGRGDQLMCYSYAENLAAGMVLAGGKPEGAGETFVLTDDVRLTLRELMTAICEALEVPARFGSSPAWLSRMTGWTLEMIWRLARRPNPPPVHRYRHHFAAHDLHFRCDKAKRLLGYRPSISLPEGLRRTAAWYRSFVKREPPPARR